MRLQGDGFKFWLTVLGQHIKGCINVILCCIQRVYLTILHNLAFCRIMPLNHSTSNISSNIFSRKNELRRKHFECN